MLRGKIKNVIMLLLVFSLNLITIDALEKFQYKNINDKESFVDESQIIYVINEFEALKLKQKEINEQFKSGNAYNLTEEDVRFISNLDKNYLNFIDRLSMEDISTLQFWGYSESQINAIKSMDRSDSTLSMAAATCTITVNINNFTHSAAGSKAIIRCQFTINGRLSGLGDDIFAVCWTENWHGTPYQASTPLNERLYGSVLYKPVSPNASGAMGQNVVQDIIPSPSGLHADMISFNKNLYGGPHNATTHYIYSGYMNIPVTHIGNQPTLIAYSEYAMNTTGLSPSVSVPYGLSFSFSWYMSVIGTGRS